MDRFCPTPATPGTLVLVCGLPGSGKTTLAKQLEEERNAVRMCPDDWIEAVLRDPGDGESERAQHRPVRHRARGRSRGRITRSGFKPTRADTPVLLPVFCRWVDAIEEHG